MLLSYPPLAQPSEPPAGLARLAGALRSHGLPCFLLDANLEGLLALLAAPIAPNDTWSRRALRHLPANLAGLRDPRLYDNPARYRRAVADVNKMVELAGQPHGLTLSLANYQEPGLLGFSLNYLSQAMTTFAMIGFLKQRYPDLPVILGGGLVTSWLRNPAWANPFAGLIDHLVAGPGEAALLHLAGLPPGPAGDPPGKPYQPPAYDGLPLADYLAPGLILPYAASAGCYWHKCSFCPEKAEDNPYTALGNDRVLAEINGLVTRTRPTLLHFLDNAVSPTLLRALADQPPGVNWYGFARLAPALTDPDFCRALRRSGCVMLKLGLESGDQGVLDAMGKGIDLTMAAQALAALNQAGIATYIYLLFGTPAETQRAARRTLDFVEQHAAAITFLNLAIFNMPLGSPEAASLAAGRFYEGDLSLYTDFVHPRGWHRKAVRLFLDQEFKRHPAIAAILRRDPPHFTSNHAPFFC